MFNNYGEFFNSKKQSVIWKRKDHYFIADEAGGDYMITVFGEDIDIHATVYNGSGKKLTSDYGENIVFTVSLLPNEHCCIQVLYYGPDGYYHVDYSKIAVTHSCICTDFENTGS